MAKPCTGSMPSFTDEIATARRENQLAAVVAEMNAPRVGYPLAPAPPAPPARPVPSPGLTPPPVPGAFVPAVQPPAEAAPLRAPPNRCPRRRPPRSRPLRHFGPMRPRLASGEKLFGSDDVESLLESFGEGRRWARRDVA